MILLKIYFLKKMKRFVYYEKRKMDLRKKEYEWQRNLILFFVGPLLIKEIYAKLNIRIVKEVKGHFVFLIYIGFVDALSVCECGPDQ